MSLPKPCRRIVWGLLLWVWSPLGWTFDHQHRIWDQLLQRHVHWLEGGHASQVDYAGLLVEQDQLQQYLQQLSAVGLGEFNQWTHAERLAFLLNAYNAFTVELVLTRYPDLDSIKELRRWFRSPWQQEFFTLFGAKRHLDYIEHDLLRAPGVYQSPRIHFGLVCASIGCPALRDQAFVPERVRAQLEDSLRRFLGDPSRNRYDPASDSLQVSSIFDWYGEDFERGKGGFRSVTQLFGQYAELLSPDPAVQERIRRGEVPIRFLPYDWGLNDRLEP